MSLADLLFGRPLASSEDQRQRLGWLEGIPTFGLDALSSAAYGPEAALTVLLPVGIAGLSYILPLTGAIILLLTIVYFSYRQTIAAYSTGGGSYTVAKENLGVRTGLLAAAALMIDYLLNVAVGISAGVGAHRVRCSHGSARSSCRFSGGPYVCRMARLVTSIQRATIAAQSRASGKVLRSSIDQRILRLQFGYSAVVPGKFCWAVSLVISS